MKKWTLNHEKRDDNNEWTKNKHILESDGSSTVVWKDFVRFNLSATDTVTRRTIFFTEWLLDGSGGWGWTGKAGGSKVCSLHPALNGAIVEGLLGAIVSTVKGDGSQLGRLVSNDCDASESFLSLLPLPKSAVARRKSPTKLLFVFSSGTVIGVGGWG